MDIFQNRHRDSIRLLTYASLLLAGLNWSAVVSADAFPLNPTGPVGLAPDENSVNVTTGTATLPVAMVVTIGDEISGLSYRRQFSWGGFFGPESAGMTYGYGSFGWRDNYNYQIAFDVYSRSWGTYVHAVTLGGTSEEFDPATLAAKIPNGSKLEAITVNQHTEYKYTGRDGAVVYFPYDYGSHGSALPNYVASYVLHPNGKKVNFNYWRKYSTTDVLAQRRLQSVNDNIGQQLRFEYQNNDDRPFSNNNTFWVGWDILSSAKAINASIDYCGIDFNPCTVFSKPWAVASTVTTGNANQSIWTVTDPLGVSGSVTLNIASPPSTAYSIVAVKGDLSYTYGFNPTGDSDGMTNARVASVSSANIASTYLWDPNTWNGLGGVRLGTRTDALGSTRMVEANERFQITHVKQKVSSSDFRDIYYSYDSNHRLRYEILPEGTISGATPTSGYVQYDYDARGNVLQRTQVPKAGSGLPNIITTADFDATCSNAITCNKPNWTRDAKDQQTDYTYDCDPGSSCSGGLGHGGILSEMRPAAVLGAPGSTVTVRPLTLTTYTQRYAWVKNSSNVLVQSSDPVWLIATVTECQTSPGTPNTPTCDASNPSTVTAYEYGATGTRESLLVKGIAVSTGGTVLRTCYSYDIYNRRISETKPNANLGACP